MPIEPLMKGGGLSQADLDNLQHNNLQGLQGGEGNERYHLTAAQVSKLDNAPAGKDHNTNLTGLQGGSSTERYHLTVAQVSKLDNAAASSDVIKVHNNLQNIQGGSSTERYHLTAAQVSKLDAAPTSSDIIKNHNSLQNLQGGNSSERYHLTAAQVSKLDGAAASGDIITTHNNLNGLQGGSSTERYHLTSAQVSKLDAAPTSSDIIKVHNNLQNIQGGSSTERYHLTSAQVSKLDAAPVSSDIIKVHNSLQGLQGGASGAYYHLTQEQYNKIVNGGGGGALTYVKEVYTKGAAQLTDVTYNGQKFTVLAHRGGIVREFIVPDGVGCIYVTAIGGGGGVKYTGNGVYEGNGGTGSKLGYIPVPVSPGDTVWGFQGDGGAAMTMDLYNSSSGSHGGGSSGLAVNGVIRVCAGGGRGVIGGTVSGTYVRDSDGNDIPYVNVPVVTPSSYNYGQGGQPVAGSAAGKHGLLIIEYYKAE